MKLFAAFVVALFVQLGLQAGEGWWVLASCQPLLVVLVATTRRLPPTTAGWCGLATGLVTDVLAERIIGPGAIAGALAGVLVALVVRRFELEGPLFWIVGSLLAATCSELVWFLVIASLGIASDHSWLGALATISTTSATGFVVATSERALRAWRSPGRQRRRILHRL